MREPNPILEVRDITVTKMAKTSQREPYHNLKHNIGTHTVLNAGKDPVGLLRRGLTRIMITIVPILR